MLIILISKRVVGPVAESTITMNGKGEVTNVLVSSSRGFGGRMPGNRTEE